MNSSEIAKLAHVSRTTVSRVLNGHANVSDATRRRVEAVIRQHNYFPEAAARNLVGKQSKVLGLFIIDLAANHDAYTISRSQFFYDYIAYAIDITNRHGYNLLTTIVHADNMDDVDRYSTPNTAAYDLLDEETKNNPAAYPSDETLSKCTLFVDLDPEVLKLYEAAFTEVLSQ